MDRSGFSNAKRKIYIFYWKIAAKSNNYGKSIHRYVIKYFKGLNWSLWKRPLYFVFRSLRLTAFLWQSNKILALLEYFTGRTEDKRKHPLPPCTRCKGCAGPCVHEHRNPCMRSLQKKAAPPPAQVGNLLLHPHLQPNQKGRKAVCVIAAGFTLWP